MEVQCAVCGKVVPPADREDHLRSDHLGPHYFRLNGRPYRTMHPSMRCSDILRHLDLPMNGYLWEVRNGKEVGYSHDLAIDLTRQPQLFLHLVAGPKTLQSQRSPIEPVVN